jgi:hypothetical protein
MNIKLLNNSPTIAQVDSKQRVDGNTRTQNSADRDADGRRDQPEEEQKRHLTQQEFDDALKALEGLPGLKANNLSIKVEAKPDSRVVLIVDSTGKVVQRLSEQRLWASTRDKDRQTGKILDKAM